MADYKNLPTLATYHPHFSVILDDPLQESNAKPRGSLGSHRPPLSYRINSKKINVNGNHIFDHN